VKIHDHLARVEEGELIPISESEGAARNNDDRQKSKEPTAQTTRNARVSNSAIVERKAKRTALGCFWKKARRGGNPGGIARGDPDKKQWKGKPTREGKGSRTGVDTGSQQQPSSKYRSHADRRSVSKANVGSGPQKGHQKKITTWEEKQRGLPR